MLQLKCNNGLYPAWCFHLISSNFLLYYCFYPRPLFFGSIKTHVLWTSLFWWPRTALLRNDSFIFHLQKNGLNPTQHNQINPIVTSIDFNRRQIGKFSLSELEWNFERSYFSPERSSLLKCHVERRKCPYSNGVKILTCRIIYQILSHWHTEYFPLRNDYSKKLVPQPQVVLIC